MIRNNIVFLILSWGVDKVKKTFMEDTKRWILKKGINTVLSCVSVDSQLLKEMVWMFFRDFNFFRGVIRISRQTISLLNLWPHLILICRVITYFNGWDVCDSL